MTPQSDPIIPFGFCHCGCGQKTKTSPRDYPKYGNVKGQPFRYIANHHSRTHQQSNSDLYRVWDSMKQRCQNPDHQAFRNYGARGITICDRWMSFEHFVADMGNRPDGMELERNDNNGNYEPGNCRWATTTEQANNKRTNVKVLIEGEVYSVRDAAIRLGISQKALGKRIWKKITLHRKSTCGDQSLDYPNNML